MLNSEEIPDPHCRGRASVRSTPTPPARSSRPPRPPMSTVTSFTVTTAIRWRSTSRRPLRFSSRPRLADRRTHIDQAEPQSRCWRCLSRLCDPETRFRGSSEEAVVESPERHIKLLAKGKICGIEPDRCGDRGSGDTSADTFVGTGRSGDSSLKPPSSPGEPAMSCKTWSIPPGNQRMVARNCQFPRGTGDAHRGIASTPVRNALILASRAW